MKENDANVVVVEGDQEVVTPIEIKPEDVKKFSIEQYDNHEEWLKMYSMTDHGNAHRMVYYFGDKIRSVRYPGRKDNSYTWYVWDGNHWRDDRRLMVQMFSQMISIAQKEADHIEDRSLREKFRSYIYVQMQANHIDGVLKTAHAIRGKNYDIQLDYADLDANPYLLNVQNGTIEFCPKEGHRFRDHRPEDYITQMAPITHNPDAECPEWLKHLDFIFRGDQEMIGFLQRALGYSITGDTSERKAFFCIGGGADGKTTTLRTIYEILGVYAHQSNNKLITSNKIKDPLGEIAGLHKRRFALISEIEKGQKLSEGLFKSLTGGDIQLGRLLYSDAFEFKPTHHLWMYGNFKPKVDGDDQALWDRIFLIEFPRRIKEDERTNMTQLIEAFKAESSGILNWLLEGYDRYCEMGLEPPETVLTATNDYRSSMSVADMFIRALCVVQEGEKIKAQDLYAAYQEWCNEDDRSPVRNREFYEALRRKGFTIKKSNGNNTIYGIALQRG